MDQERYLGSMERHGVRGGYTAQERVLLAAQDNTCARCQTATLDPPKSAHKVKRLCVPCQISIQNDALARYFPEI